MRILTSVPCAVAIGFAAVMAATGLRSTADDLVEHLVGNAALAAAIIGGGTYVGFAVRRRRDPGPGTRDPDPPSRR